MGSAPGGYAEYAVTDAARVHRIPANNMTFEQAACLPVALQTMHNAIVTAGRLKRGETLLIQGASSGVGLMGMQIGKVMGAALVMGTSTNPARRARLKEFGCDLALDTSDPKWPDEVKKATGGKGVDLIVDQVSASVANQNLEAAAMLGRIVNVGRLGGMKGEFDFDLHALKRIDYIGVTFRTRTLEERARDQRPMRADLWPALEAGKLSACRSTRTFPLEKAADALADDAGQRAFRQDRADDGVSVRRMLAIRGGRGAVMPLGHDQAARRRMNEKEPRSVAGPGRSVRGLVGGTGCRRTWMKYPDSPGKSLT